MLETIAIAFIFSKIKGFKIKPIFKDWSIYLIIVAELLYWIVQVNIFMGNYDVINYVAPLKTIYMCSYLPLIFKYEIYIHAIIGSIFMVIGGFLNDIAIWANGGMMPVFPSVSYLTGYARSDIFERVNDIHVLGTSSTNFKFLTDIFDLGYSVLSIGDIFIRVYVFMVIYYSIKKINNIDKTKKEKSTC